jgi:hypothetical protein
MEVTTEATGDVMVSKAGHIVHVERYGAAKSSIVFIAEDKRVQRKNLKRLRKRLPAAAKLLKTSNPRRVAAPVGGGGTRGIEPRASGGGGSVVLRRPDRHCTPALPVEWPASELSRSPMQRHYITLLGLAVGCERNSPSGGSTGDGPGYVASSVQVRSRRAMGGGGPIGVGRCGPSLAIDCPRWQGIAKAGKGLPRRQGIAEVGWRCGRRPSSPLRSSPDG